MLSVRQFEMYYFVADGHSCYYYSYQLVTLITIYYIICTEMHRLGALRTIGIIRMIDIIRIIWGGEACAFQ